MIIHFQVCVTAVSVFCCAGRIAAVTVAEAPAAPTAGTATAAAQEGEPSPATPTAGAGGDEEHPTAMAKWAEARRAIQSRATVPSFTEQTVDIITRFVSGQCS